jgi:hypothetical protein
VFPNGRTVHIPSDGRPLSGYALALADIEKRGSSPPSQTSLEAAQAARTGVRKKSLFSALFHIDEEEDDAAQATAGSAASSAPGSHSLNLAAADAKTEAARAPAVPAARPQRVASVPVVLARAASNDATSGSGERDTRAMAILAEPARPAVPTQATPRIPLTHPDRTPKLAPWPIRDLAMDRAPVEVMLADAAQPQGEGDAELDTRTEAVESGLTRSVAVRRINTVVAKKNSAPVATAAPVQRVKALVQGATAGMRYDDPWLRAIILAPRLYGSMTVTLYGESDFTELRALMRKPTTSVAMSFSDQPYPGLTANGFSGEAVVLLNIYAFPQQTAWLQ